MDRYFDNHHALQINISIDLPNIAHEKNQPIFNAYDYQSGKPKQLELSNDLLIQEAMVEYTQALLREIIYLEALINYYQLYQASFGEDSVNPNSYFNQNNYFDSNTHFNPNAYCNRQNHFNPSHHHRSKGYIFKSFVPHSLSHPKHSSVQSETPPFHSSSFSSRLIFSAERNLGRPVWALSKFAGFCQRGYLGCAASVSELLQDAGLRIKDSASVSGVVGELHNLGWQKIRITDKEQFHAGDIVYGMKGSHAHIGIITAADQNKILVCDNSSSTGTLKERTIEAGGSFVPGGRFAGSLFVMRPVET